jgi:hypothetical protein
MARYKVTVPFQDDMGSIMPFIATSTPMETKSANALWTINSMRDHDGLPHLTRMPVGTTYELIEERA